MIASEGEILCLLCTATFLVKVDFLTNTCNLTVAMALSCMVKGKYFEVCRKLGGN